jgi:predicted MPP superfamily phosphohydrolase
MLTRRRALKSLFAAGTAAALTGLYTWRWEPHWLEFTYPVLPVRGLPPALEGRTLAQITDTHIGPEVDDGYVIDSFRRTQEQSPDFVVCTGDWISYRDERQFAQLRSVLAHMPRGRLGTVGILGNHDYGHRWSMLDVADEVSRIAAEKGITMLRNESRTVSGLRFIGLDDYWGPRFDPVPVLAKHGRNEASASSKQANTNAPMADDVSTIVLVHNPDVADLPVWGSYQGWILAGHTHGGQCKPPFLPPPELPVKNRRYTSGKFALSGNRRMYISRGVGHLLRVRFNARPEIPIFTLRTEI